MEQTLTNKLKTIIGVFRPLRWYRNIFMLLGTFLALKLNNLPLNNISSPILLSLLLSFVATCLIASGNYGINEVADAKSDSYHPKKKERAIPNNKIDKLTVIAISIVLYALGFAAIFILDNKPLLFSLSLLFVSGMTYNIPPIRLKDIPYVDFTFEAINNPIRLLIGWYAVTNIIIPISLLFLFWFVGIFLMTAKRFGEIRFIENPTCAIAYRKSLAWYTEKKLLLAMIAAISAAMFMFGILVAKHQISLVLLLPFFIIFIVWFFLLAYDKDSIVKDPERIFEKPIFLLYTFSLVVSFILLLEYPIKWLDFFAK